ncbi:unnamed protein product [Caenorhabditis sp. 36 PRJEB53466]|nr:unnamed protein product [Caenorhabditis sp. 36 PRJEB53466]
MNAWRQNVLDAWKHMMSVYHYLKEDHSAPDTSALRGLNELLLDRELAPGDVTDPNVNNLQQRGQREPLVYDRTSFREAVIRIRDSRNAELYDRSTDDSQPGASTNSGTASAMDGITYEDWARGNFVIPMESQSVVGGSSNNDNGVGPSDDSSSFLNYTPNSNDSMMQIIEGHMPGCQCMTNARETQNDRQMDDVYAGRIAEVNDDGEPMEINSEDSVQVVEDSDDSVVVVKDSEDSVSEMEDSDDSVIVVEHSDEDELEALEMEDEELEDEELENEGLEEPEEQHVRGNHVHHVPQFPIWLTPFRMPPFEMPTFQLHPFQLHPFEMPPFQLHPFQQFPVAMVPFDLQARMDFPLGLAHGPFHSPPPSPNQLQNEHNMYLEPEPAGAIPAEHFNFNINGAEHELPEQEDEVEENHDGCPLPMCQYFQQYTITTPDNVQDKQQILKEIMSHTTRLLYDAAELCTTDDRENLNRLAESTIIINNAFCRMPTMESFHGMTDIAQKVILHFANEVCEFL